MAHKVFKVLEVVEKTFFYKTRGRRGWYGLWFNFYYSFMKSPDMTETESLGLGLGFRAFGKTRTKIKPYVVPTSPTSHFVEKCLLYKHLCWTKLYHIAHNESILKKKTGKKPRNTRYMPSRGTAMNQSTFFNSALFSTKFDPQTNASTP